MADFIAPQLLVATESAPEGNDWCYELKYDGYRAQVHVTARGIKIFTRNGLDWTDRFPHLARELAAVIHVPCVLDGEVYAPDASGRPSFTTLCNHLNGAGRVHFVAFDILEINGTSTLSLPLGLRRQRLTAAVPVSSSIVHLVPQSAESVELCAFARRHGWEGIVAKAVSGVYRPGFRSKDWLKLKLKQRQEFVIAGWRPDPKTGAIKSLVLATVDGGKLTLRGSVGTGFTLDQRRKLPSRFTPVRSRSNVPGRPGFIPLEPELIAEIEYLELSGHGIVRQPTFLGLRADKAAADVGLELPAP
jgi:DNA ligase D-like protein (predicted ligase)